MSIQFNTLHLAPYPNTVIPPSISLPLMDRPYVIHDMRVFLGGGPYLHWPQNFKDDLCVANDDNLYLSYYIKDQN